MSGIAEVLLNLGFDVSGSDMKSSDITARLAVRMGAAIWQGHDRTARRRRRRGRVLERRQTRQPRDRRGAHGMGIPIIPRGEMLAELLRLKYAVTVGGAHGKTSTTSLIASVLAQGGSDPTVIVGGKVRALSSNARLGQQPLRGGRSRRERRPVRATCRRRWRIITNIDLEHLDFYPNLTAIEDAFQMYANRVPFYGAVILCADDAAHDGAGAAHPCAAR